MRFVAVVVATLWGGVARADYRVSLASCEASSSGLSSYEKYECRAYAKNNADLCRGSLHEHICRALVDAGAAKKVLSSSVWGELCGPSRTSADSAHTHHSTTHRGGAEYAWCKAVATGDCSVTGLIADDKKFCDVLFPTTPPAPVSAREVPEDTRASAVAYDRGRSEVRETVEDRLGTIEEDVDAEEDLDPSVSSDPRSYLRRQEFQPRDYTRVATEDVGTLVAASERLLPVFGELGLGWARVLGGTWYMRSSVKDVGRTIDKASATGAGDPVATQRDTLAGTITVASLPEMLAAIEALPGLVEANGCRIVRMKNRIENPALRDFLLNIRMPEGLVVEVQLHFQDVIAVKQLDGGEKAPRDYDGRGVGSGALLDAKAGTIGMKEMHTHDSYDYVRELEAMDAELAPYWSNLDGWATRGDQATVTQLTTSAAAFLRKSEEFMRSLTALQTGLMGETWKGIATSADDAAALEALGRIKEGDVVPEGTSSDQDLAALGTFLEGAGGTTLARIKARDAERILARMPAGDSAAGLAAVLTKYADKLDQLIAKTKAKAATKQAYTVDYTMATEVVSVMRRLARVVPE